MVERVQTVKAVVELLIANLPALHIPEMRGCRVRRPSRRGGIVTPEANTPDPQMIRSQLELKPSRDHQEMVSAQLTLSDEGLFRIQARGLRVSRSS